MNLRTKIATTLLALMVISCSPTSSYAFSISRAGKVAGNSIITFGGAICLHRAYDFYKKSGSRLSAFSQAIASAFAVHAGLHGIYEAVLLDTDEDKEDEAVMFAGNDTFSSCSEQELE